MFSPTEKKLVFYTALFITVVFNSARLMALRPSAFIAQYWHFNGYELLCQAILNFAVCLAVAYFDMLFVHSGKNAHRRVVLAVFANILLLAAGFFAGVVVQVQQFRDETPVTVFRGGYIVRLAASQVLMGFLTKIMLLLRESKAKNKENEQLRSAYLKAQLELLKEELNPHFFFNTLSSLSAVVREDAAKAQHYISHLSKMFRYTLSSQDRNMVTLNGELAMLESYVALQKMRFEEGLIVSIDLPGDCYNSKLPYMSLQPLMENAVKHNMATTASPLKIEIFLENGMVVIQNNLQPVRFAVDGAGIGLANLNERYRILTHSEIVIKKTTDKFIVKLPLQTI